MNSGSHRIAEIAAAIAAEVHGDLDLVVSGVAEPQMADENDLALAMNPKYADGIAQGRARAAMLWEGADWKALGLKAAIIPTRPRFAMSGLTRMMDPGQGFGEGIHPTAIVHETAELGDDVVIGPFSIIAANARIGAGSIIGPQCYIGTGAQIGSTALLRESVSIGARVRIGERFIAQPGARIGGDGFSFTTEELSSVESARNTLGDQQETTAQSWHRIHSLGAVTIGDDVEIGTNSAIDCGTIRDTEIGDRTKIDNLVHIGHNCVVGLDCLICGQVGMAGSVKVGNNVVLGGQVGVSDNIFIGDRVIAGGATKIFSNVPAGRTILGHPATKMDAQIESYKALRRLPRVLRDVAALKKALAETGSED